MTYGLSPRQFSRPFPPPVILCNAVGTFLGGGVGRGRSTDSGPEGLDVSLHPAMDLLCDPGQVAPLLRTSISTVFKTNDHQHYRPLQRDTGHCQVRNTLCLIPVWLCPLSPEQPRPRVYARAVGWSAVPVEYTRSGSGAKGARGRDDWESQQCGGEYGFMKITFGSNYGSNGSEPQSAASHPQRQKGR